MNRELDCLFEAWDRERLDDPVRDASEVYVMQALTGG